MKLTHLPVIILTMALVACDGGEKAVDQAKSPVEDSYIGFSYAANLSTNNSFEYLQQVFTGSSTASLAKTAGDSQADETTEQISLLALQATFSTVASNITASNYQDSPVSETHACQDSGSMKLTSEVDADTDLGIINAEMINCDNGTGQLKGSVEMDITRVGEANQPLAYTLSFNGVTLGSNSHTSYLTGTQSFDSRLGIDTTTSNILQTLPDSRQILTEDFKVVDNTLESFYTDTTETGIDVSGKIYLSDHGHIDIYTTDLFQRLSTTTLPYSGSMDLIGNMSSLNVFSDKKVTLTLTTLSNSNSLNDIESQTVRVVAITE